MKKGHLFFVTHPSPLARKCPRLVKLPPPPFLHLNFVSGGAMTDAAVSLFLTLTDICSMFFLRTEAAKACCYILTC